MSNKRYEHITLNGQPFVLDTKHVITRDSLFLEHLSRRTIWDCYERPSDTKVSIFKWLDNWFSMNNGRCGVRSYNCNFFTLDGVVRDNVNNHWYYCDITYANNRCYEIVD